MVGWCGLSGMNMLFVFSMVSSVMNSLFECLMYMLICILVLILVVCSCCVSCDVCVLSVLCDRCRLFWKGIVMVGVLGVRCVSLWIW